MAFGPMELLMVRFPGNQFTGEIVPAITELVENGTVHIVDMLFITCVRALLYATRTNA